MFLGGMLLIALAILAPDYFACHQLHFFKSAEEARDESLEALDMRRFIREPVRSIAIDYNSLSIVVDGDIPKLNQTLVENIQDAWDDTYFNHHPGRKLSYVCSRTTWIDLQGHTVHSCIAVDSVLTLLVGNCF
jgi:hypothetical protein